MVEQSQSELLRLPPYIDQEDKILLKDFDIDQSEHFIKFVFIPYFKDIYNDLAEKSSKVSSIGINKIVFTEYANLPGILSERFFKIIDENSDENIDQKEFIHAMFKVYYSKLESKIKLVFDIYDFDSDGFISKEDIRIVLSHVPISHVNKVFNKENQSKEGKFTQEGGGFQIDYQDRIDIQKEILIFLDFCFQDKTHINIIEFTRIIEEKSSEMLLSIITLLQDKLPCSENFFRFQNNYEQIALEGSNQSIQKSSSPTASPRQIASPKYLRSLSPVQQYMSRGQGLMMGGFNINTESQKNLLKYAVGKENLEKLAQTLDGNKDVMMEDVQMSEPQQPDEQYVINNIPIEKFKQNQIAMMQGKMVKLDKQFEEVKQAHKSGSPHNFIQSIRLPNMKSPKVVDEKMEGESILSDTREGFQSPTRILEGNQPVLDNFRTASDEVFREYEGEMMRKTPDGKFKKYWFCLLSKELYCYRKKNDDKHKNMHNLVGVFIKPEPEEIISHNGKQIIFYPFKLVFPFNKSRIYYLMTLSQRDKWVEVIKEAIGYANLEDFYEIKKTLGKGKYGQVKQAIHKKTQKSVAIKIIQKKDMHMHELELQKREIEVLKICQHPNIIRLLDVFENPEYIYIVLEYMEGGDLFSYLEKREFKITEDRARSIAHQVAAAIYYLHSYGIAHRDLKLENIMMVDSSDHSELKVVDFGLSKILGPSETSTEPFGTLSYVAPEVLLQKPYGKSVDLWSLGVIIYVMLSGLLPFDAGDTKETIRQTLYEDVQFLHPCWKYASNESKHLIRSLLHKDRFKRMSTEEVLTHPWICKKSLDMLEKRRNSGDLEKFSVYTATLAKYVTPNDMTD